MLVSGVIVAPGVVWCVGGTTNNYITVLPLVGWWWSWRGRVVVAGSTVLFGVLISWASAWRLVR